MTAIGIAAVTLWRPRWGLVATVALLPAGALFAPAPARPTELFAWAFLAAWLIRGARPSRGAAYHQTVSFPVAVYGGVLVTSWLSLTVAGSAGVPWSALPRFLVQSIPADYLIFSVSEPETWALLQAAAGLGLFIAALDLTRGDPAGERVLTLGLVFTLVALAIAAPVAVGRQWAATGYADWFAGRFLERGERFSLHMGDVNAAGSLYVIGSAVAAAHLLTRPRERWWWSLAVGALAPAIWLAGSRSSYLGIATACLILAAVAGGWTRLRRPVATLAVVTIAIVAVATMVAPGSSTQGGVRESATLRGQFLETSARMFATSPIYGVGIGRYFNRSAEFMTPELRELYGNENAHNYFAQQFSELGLSGGLAFLWLVATALGVGWRRVRESPVEPVTLALLSGAGGYLVTCMTGHPLLVPEAALPFWAVLGALAATTIQGPAAPGPRIVAVVSGIVLATGLVLAVQARAAEPPGDAGFHGIETAEDGTAFRWMTRHSVTHIPDGEGFLRLRLRAEERPPLARPLFLETSIAGRVADRREVVAGSWTTVDIPARRTGLLFRRVDFRVNQFWTEEVRLGQRTARRPITVMAADIHWVPAR